MAQRSGVTPLGRRPLTRSGSLRGGPSSLRLIVHSMDDVMPHLDLGRRSLEPNTGRETCEPSEELLLTKPCFTLADQFAAVRDGPPALTSEISDRVFPDASIQSRVRVSKCPKHCTDPMYHSARPRLRPSSLRPLLAAHQGRHPSGHQRLAPAS